MDQNEVHVSEFVSGVVMLAAILITYTTYLNYKDDQVATAYEEDGVSMDQAASALVSLRMMKAEMAPTLATTTTDLEVKTE